MKSKSKPKPIPYFAALKLIQKGAHVGTKRAKEILKQMFYLGLWEWDGDGKIKIKKPQLILGGENLEKEN